MKKTIEFKNREATARLGKLPDEVLIFTDFDMKKNELDMLYDAVRFEIGRCSKKEFYHVIEVYINLMIDIEDVLEEIKNKYKNHDKYTFQLPLHIFELNFIVKALKDYRMSLENNIDDESNSELYKLNLLLEKVMLLLKDNYKALKRLYVKYDKAKRLSLLKHLWNNLYELSGED